MSAQLIIVGAGQAAAQAIQTLVQKSYAGRVTVIGEEPHPPYQRPPLSKKYLSGDLERKRLYIRPIDFYAQNGIDLVLGARAEQIDRAGRRVILGDGRGLGYDELLLATGSRVRIMDVPGADLDGIHYLRRIDDADAIAAELKPGRRLVVVGGGYIGLEAAAVARTRGLAVTVIETADRVLARVVCPEVSEFYRRIHEAAGVRVLCGGGVREFVGDGRIEAVVTSDGVAHPCELAVVGVGILPNTELAERAGLRCDNGICVDERARSSDPRIFAAGDCSNHPNEIFGRRVRLESVHNAIEQAKTAALTILGEDQPYAQVPWFWSDQYDVKLQIAGLSQGYDRIALRGDTAERRFAAYYLREGRIIAVDAVNSPKDFLLAKKLIAARALIETQDIEDPTIDLESAAQTPG